MRPHKPFDTVTKELIEVDPLAWLHLVGLPGEAVQMEDTNLTTLTADADRVMRVSHTSPYIANLEMQATDKEEGTVKSSAMRPSCTTSMRWRSRAWCCCCGRRQRGQVSPAD